MDIDRQSLRAPTVAHAPHRRGAEMVEADRYARMRIGCTKAVGGIESDPAEIGYEGFRPGVARILRGHAVVAAKIAAHVARRNAEATGGRNEDMGEVLTDAVLGREGLRRLA